MNSVPDPDSACALRGNIYGRDRQAPGQTLHWVLHWNYRVGAKSAGMAQEGLNHDI